MKKILALALTLVFALGMMVPVGAASAKVTDALIPTVLSFDGVDLRPDRTYKIFDYGAISPGASTVLTSTNFPFAFNTTYTTPAATATEDTWKAFWKTVFKTVDNMPIRIRHRAGTKVVDDAYLDYTLSNNGTTITIGLYIDTIEPFVSVDDVDFEIDIYYVIDGWRTDDIFYINLTGNFANEVTEVFADSVEADTWQGQVIDAQEYVGKIALIGNKDEDVIAHVKMANGKKIYFRVTTDGDIKDEPIMDKYPSIEFAYTVQSIGLSSISGNFIELAGVDEAYYVYGKNADGSLKYLGRGGELLPYSAKYYISSEKLDLDEDVIEDLPEEDDVPGPSYNPSTGI